MKWMPASRASAITCSRARRSGTRRARARPPAAGSVGRRAGDDPDPAHALGAGVEHERLAPGHLAHAREQLGGRRSRRRRTSPSRPIVRERRSWRSQPSRSASSALLPTSRVRVERQVVGRQRDVVLEQRAQPLGQRRRQAGGHGSPRTGRGGRARARRSSATARSISSRCADDAGDDLGDRLAARAPGARSARGRRNAPGSSSSSRTRDRVIGNAHRGGFKWHDYGDPVN